MRAEVSYVDGAHDDSRYAALVISDWGNHLDVILAETHADADDAGRALMEKIAEETGESIEEHDLSYYVFERN